MIEVKEIGRTLADEIVVKNHYSGTKCFGTKVSLGIYYNGDLEGVAQFGSGINPQGTTKWVEGSTTKDYLEFNRMWLSDRCPKNSESQAIGLIFKWFKANMPQIKWLLSFADGTIGNAGTIYQATNWIYTGYSTLGGFWVLSDGTRVHNKTMQSKHKSVKRDFLESIYGTPLYRVNGGQFRYIYFLDKKWKSRLTAPQLPYPKQRNLKEYLIIKDGWYSKRDCFEDYITLLSLRDKGEFLV